jgi:hypothetical protein
MPEIQLTTQEPKAIGLVEGVPETQDIFRLYGDQYLAKYQPPPHVCKAVRAIQNCRTAALGGHMDSCDECGFVKISYNSCRNRHCPKCQALSKERWVMAQEVNLLPVQYFHVVFTLPQELHELAIRNRVAVFNLLFKSAADTLKLLGLNKKYLGAETGFTAILHTWGQNLMFHPHVHVIIPGGGVTAIQRWRNSRKKFFIPVKVMAKLFRGKFLHGLQQIRHSLQGLEDDEAWSPLRKALYAKNWYVYCKRPFKTPNSVLQYLGRYTHRIAISNHRIVSVHDGNVSFKWRDYKDRSKEKVMTLTAHEFIRRFLLHILPPGFTKIRHYGFLASAVKKTKLALCKRLTGVKIVAVQKLSAAQLMERLTGRDISLCPCCGIGRFDLWTGRAPPVPA